jgi:hypothetical protein
LAIASTANYVGIFGVVSGGAVIKNFVLDESCSIQGSAYVGIIGGSNGSGTIMMERLGNEGSVTAINQNAGGIFGCNMSGAATPVFLNCYVTGPVKGAKESGQITGYAGNGQAYNCYASGTIEGVYYTNMADCMLRGGPASQNCYSTAGKDNKAELISQEDVENGTLAWLLNGERFDEVPVNQTDFHHAKPVLEYFPGWNEDISIARTFEDLPKNAQDYVLALEKMSNTRISVIGVGPERDQVIVRHDLLD